MTADGPCGQCDRLSLCPYHEGYEDGRDEERRAVLAWVRARVGYTCRLIARAIDRGEHRG